MSAEAKIEITIGGHPEGALRAFEMVGRAAQQLADGLRIGLGIDIFQKIIGGLQQIPIAIERAVKTGISFNSTLEDSRLGVAAILKQFNPDAFHNFDDALAVAGGAIESLKQKAKESPASFRQLVQAFQANAGAAMAANIPLQKQIDLTVLMSQALAGLGIRSEQIIQESRALLTGNITEDAAAAKMLQITREQIEAAKEEGRLYDFLASKLAAFAEAGKRGAATYSTRLSNLGDTFDQVMGKLSQPIFETLKNAYERLTTAIEDPRFAQQLEKIVAGINALVKAGMTLAQSAVQHAQSISDAFLLIAASVGIASAALTAFYTRAALLPLAPLAEKLSVLTVLQGGALSIGSLKASLLELEVVLSSAAGWSAILGSALAGVFAGRWLDQMDVAGLRVGQWAQLAYLEIFGTWEKVKSYLAGAGDYIFDSMAIAWERILVMLKEKQVQIATILNAIWMGGPKFNTAEMEQELAVSRQALALLEQSRSKSLETAVQAAADRLAAERKGLEASGREVQFGADANTKKSGKDAKTNSRPLENTTEGKQFLSELEAAWRKAFLTKRQLEDVAYAEGIEKIEAEIKNKTDQQIAFKTLDQLHAQNVKNIDKEELQAFDDLIAEEMKAEEEAAKKRLQLTMQTSADQLKIDRDAIALRRAELEANFKMPEFDKKGARVELLDEEIGLVDKLIAKLKVLRDQQTDEAARESINQQITGLEGEDRNLKVARVGLVNAPGNNSIVDQLTKKWSDIQTAMGTMAEQSAKAFETVWNSAVSNVTSNLTGMITGTKTVGEALKGIWQSIVTDIIQEFVRMAVQWVLTHVFMNTIFAAFAAVREAIRGGETASEAAHTSARVATHEAGEGAKTGATGFGALSRGIIAVGETIWHGIQIAFRVASHLAGEAAMTAITVADSAIRTAATIPEAMADLVSAAMKGAKAVADIPYVGPILAVAAMAAIIGAGVKYIGGFKKGGYTGDGDPSGVAGVTHYGEVVMEAPAVSALGKENLMALRAGGWGAVSARMFGAMGAVAKNAVGADRMVMAGMARPVTSEPQDAAELGAGMAGGGAGSAPVVNVAPTQAKLVIVDNEEQAARVMESERGWTAIKKHLIRRGHEVGIRT